MRVLLIGSGGREDALAWKMAQSPRVEKIFIAPGNGGTSKYGENVNIPVEDISELVNFAKNNKIDLTMVGPEIPLVMGIVDAFEEEGLKVVGPSKLAAQMEGSKDFAKALMIKYNIPTAAYGTFTDYESALAYVNEKGAPIVIKADGLAAGKGVIVAMDIDTARKAVADIMQDKMFGSSGARVVIEEFMEGEEASLLAFTDGNVIVPMVSAQDHKRVFDGDRGPNTGGMGTYSPAPVVTEEVYKKIYDKVLVPTIEGLKKEGIKYKGILYAGLMIKNGEPRVVEFNARFGDPETQVILPRLKTDIVDIFEAIADERLDKVNVEWYDNAAVCVVIAAKGYPDKYEKGKEIKGIEDALESGLMVFHAGTKADNGKILSSGGRVLNVVAIADDIEKAVAKVYGNIEKVGFDGCFYRKDIAHRAINRK